MGRIKPYSVKYKIYLDQWKSLPVDSLNGRYAWVWFWTFTTTFAAPSARLVTCLLAPRAFWWTWALLDALRNAAPLFSTSDLKTRPYISDRVCFPTHTHTMRSGIQQTRMRIQVSCSHGRWKHCVPALGFVSVTPLDRLSSPVMKTTHFSQEPSKS